jgi:pyridinium-3,5-bisthiocarboxylic acid mononucleotide nickel chelatase
MTTAWFDCFSGASGDMILGAFVDAGLALSDLEADLACLPCAGEFSLKSERVMRCGIAATHVHVHTHEHHHDHGHHHHRGLNDIRALIGEATLPNSVKDRAIAIFTRLGEAEAAVHGVSVDEVHFHEVGAVDAIVDIVGAACAIERLGISDIRFSSLSLGGGSVKCAHGILPVPAPATARLVEGFECSMGPVQHELLTPTGAAILTTLGTQSPLTGFCGKSVGYGAGSRDTEGVPNVLRVMIGETTTEEKSDAPWLLETNLDDISPEIVGYVVERLLACGVLDVWTTAIQMKKSRPGILLSVLVGDTALHAAEELILRETTTFGIRRRRVERTTLERKHVEVDTPYGRVRIKVGCRNGTVLTAAPEYEDCRKLAEEHDACLNNVMEAARRAFLDS